MSKSESYQSNVDALNTLVANSIQIVEKLIVHVKDIYVQADKQCCAKQVCNTEALSSEKWEPTSTLNALALAQDAAALIRAHATKISLLMINEPFTPTAISKVVKDMMGSAVPALPNAAQECYGDRYTYGIQRELASRCERVLAQVLILLNTIPKDGTILKPGKNKASASKGADSGRGDRSKAGGPERSAFMEVGILWSECDSVAALAKAGVRSRVIQIMERLAATLKDELEELKEWGDEEDEEDDDSGSSDDDEDDDDDEITEEADADGDNRHASVQDMLDDLMNSRNYISKADPKRLRPRLEMSLKKIRMTQLLCTAIVKRRLRTLPVLPTEKPSDVAARLDNTMMILQELPDRIGDLAESFYDLSAPTVDSHMEQCFEDAFAAAELMRLGWDGKQDAFSDWLVKFQSEIRSPLQIEE